jgi:hypothetical protein
LQTFITSLSWNVRRIGFGRLAPFAVGRFTLPGYCALHDFHLAVGIGTQHTFFLIGSALLLFCRAFANFAHIPVARTVGERSRSGEFSRIRIGLALMFYDPHTGRQAPAAVG